MQAKPPEPLLWHVCPPVQVTPHAPQLGLADRSVLQPFVTGPLQCAKPALHVPRPHPPLLQT